MNRPLPTLHSDPASRPTDVARRVTTVCLFALLTAGQAAGQPPEPAAAPRNLLGWAEGVFTVRPPNPKRSEAPVIALDGVPDTRPIGVPRHAPLPHEWVVELPAVTRFSRFAVPKLGEFGPAKGKHVKTVEIHGSNISAGDGFGLLATLKIETGQPGGQQFAVDKEMPVRWLKIRLLDRHTPQENDADAVLFSELLGYGAQEARQPPEKGFNGIWTLRRGYDVSRNLLELKQEGGEIRGCQVLGGQHSAISGSVEDGMARLVTTSVQGGRKVSVPMIARITSEGEIHGVSSFHGGLSPFSGVPAPAGTPSPCPGLAKPSNPVETALKAGLAAVLYGIHFDVDSDILRPDAAPALEQILAALVANPNIRVTIEGHTDSDGSDAHNLDLSQRRATAVVAWLTDRKLPADRLQALGKGETTPMADNASAVGRAMNRRVEVRPQ
jgi:hypothetical protein